jgi:hypothetical protein
MPVPDRQGTRPADPAVLPAIRRHPWQDESLQPKRNGMSGGVLESRGMPSRTSEVLTEIQGANPTDEFINVRRRKAHDAYHLQELGHLHAVENPSRFTGYDLSDGERVRRIDWRSRCLL